MNQKETRKSGNIKIKNFSKGLTSDLDNGILYERFGEAVGRMMRRDGRVVDGAGLENQ